MRALLYSLPLQVMPKFTDAEIENMFYSGDRSHDGKLFNSELRLIFLKIDPSITNEKIKEYIAKYDTANSADGYLNLEEFKQMMKEIYP